MLYQAGHHMTSRFIFLLNFWYVFTNKPFYIIVWVWPTCFWVGDRGCVFSMYPRGDEAGFWDKLCPCGWESCAITHTNTLRTATRSAGQGYRKGGTCPWQIQTPTHSSPTAFLIPPLAGPCLLEVTWGTTDCPPLILQIRKLGTTVYSPKSHRLSRASLSSFLLTYP